jgi:hypothetical protein
MKLTVRRIRPCAPGQVLLAVQPKLKTMKTRTVLLIMLLTALAVSCIPSLYPLYEQKDLLVDERLDGIFYSDNDEYWQIELLDPEWERKFSDNWDMYNSGKTYKLVVREDELVQDFALHLLKIGDDHYMDFYPVDFEIPDKLLRHQLIPAHTFVKAEISDEYLVIHFFDNDWLEELFEQKKIKLSHTELNERYLLTAKTNELQKFIGKYANDSTTFFEADTLFRKPV